MQLWRKIQDENNRGFDSVDFNTIGADDMEEEMMDEQFSVF